ncbi:cell division protein SepF [Methanotorris formicicus]|uniref:Cell division protein SepF n=1 Tax=Methanotorris formicicus Mc-S-70 TaxID=647171 RepID=H1KX29_9EURY|nr:cell division protein SepF [Methanotorris formicicus]EHP88554.1 hypothetical protein MetfoDRAFT_0352 [Methanotorris formicicus Mc-S-70]
MVFEKLKELFGSGKTDIKQPAPITIEEYVELPMAPVEEEKSIRIKVCDLNDGKDAVNIIVMVEAGYLVIANTPHLERDIDEEYAAILSKLKNEITKIGGKMVGLSETKIFIVPRNVIIEKIVKEEKEKKEVRNTEEEQNNKNE